MIQVIFHDRWSAIIIHKYQKSSLKSMKSEQPVFDRVCADTSTHVNRSPTRLPRWKGESTNVGEQENEEGKWKTCRVVGGSLSPRSLSAPTSNQISRQLRLCCRRRRLVSCFRCSCSVKYSDIWQNVFDNGLYNWVLDVAEWFDSVCCFMLTTTEWFLICAPSSLDLSPWTIRKFDF